MSAMSYFQIIIFSELLFLVYSGNNDYKFFPNLPAGEYKVYAKAILACEKIQKPLITMNWYLSKLSSNVSELRGNMTLKIPIDDSLGINLIMDVKDSIGGWKNNAILYRSPSACTTLKNLVGSEWSPFYKSFGYNNTDCPIASGFYITKGYDLTKMVMGSNFPKTFFYGTYKLRYSFEDKNKISVGCIIFVLDIKRPWENI